MTIRSEKWHAWLNTMPPKPDDLHVSGDITVSNPGVRPTLTMRAPQGINATIAAQNLHSSGGYSQRRSERARRKGNPGQ